MWTAKAVAIYPDGKKAVAKIPITVTDPEVEELQKAPRIYADLIVNPKEIDL